MSTFRNPGPVSCFDTSTRCSPVSRASTVSLRGLGPNRNLVLIDEINRAPAKTQSSLFEVMEEKQITMDGVTYRMEQKAAWNRRTHKASGLLDRVRNEGVAVAEAEYGPGPGGLRGPGSGDRP